MCDIIFYHPHIICSDFTNKKKNFCLTFEKSYRVSNSIPLPHKPSTNFTDWLQETKSLISLLQW